MAPKAERLALQLDGVVVADGVAGGREEVALLREDRLAEHRPLRAGRVLADRRGPRRLLGLLPGAQALRRRLAGVGHEPELVDASDELLGVAGAVVRRLREHVHHQAGEAGVGEGRLGDRFGDVFVGELTDLARERRASGEHHVAHDAERVDVRGGADLAARRLLRRHVARGPEELPVQRELGGGLLGFEDADEAEVEDLRDLGVAVRLEDHVPGLEVAVDELVFVRGAEPLGDRAHDVGGPGGRKRPVLSERAGECPPRQVLHHHEQKTLVGRAEVGYRDDVGVLDARQRAALADEALREGLVRREFAVHHLDGEVLIQVAVRGPVDARHPAGSEELRDGVAADRPPDERIDGALDEGSPIEPAPLHVPGVGRPTFRANQHRRRQSYHARTSRSDCFHGRHNPRAGAGSPTPCVVGSFPGASRSCAAPRTA